MRLKSRLRSARPSERQSSRSRSPWRSAPKQPTQNIAGKKRAGQEDVDSDYLFRDCSQRAVSRFEKVIGCQAVAGVLWLSFASNLYVGVLSLRPPGPGFGQFDGRDARPTMWRGRPRPRNPAAAGRKACLSRGQDTSRFWVTVRPRACPRRGFRRSAFSSKQSLDDPM